MSETEMREKLQHTDEFKADLNKRYEYYMSGGIMI